MLLNYSVGEEWWRRPLRIPWTARRSNQSILKEISPEYWLEGLMLKLKLQYFGHLMGRTDSLGKTLLLGKTEGRRRRGRRKLRWLDGMTQWTWVWASSGSWWWTGNPGVLQSMGSQKVRYDWATELNWTEPLWWEMFITRETKFGGRSLWAITLTSSQFCCEPKNALKTQNLH